jgi:hypothetical protein
MSFLRKTNLNKYTLIERDSKEDRIIFYPEFAINGVEIKRPLDTLRVKFVITKGNDPQLYVMHVSLVNKGDIELYNSYSIYLKQTNEYKYILLKTLNDFDNADILPRAVIDFETIDYNEFLKALTNNEELQKMVPALKKALEENITDLEEEQRKVQTINIPSPSNYYQNISGSIINEIEKVIANKEEKKLSDKILKNVYKNYRALLHDKYQYQLFNISMYATYLSRIKSNMLKPRNILETKDLKLDTNKQEITYQDFDEIMCNFIDYLRTQSAVTEDLNIIQERIEYIITYKPRIKEFKNYAKIIMCDDKFIDKNKRVRAIKESELKELILRSLSNQTYRPLPRNQVILYNIEDKNIINFIGVFSLDKIMEILGTYKTTNNEEIKQSKKKFEIVEKIIKNEPVTKNEIYIKLLIEELLTINVYCYKNVPRILILSKGEYILNLDYKKGEYDINIINKNSRKSYGKLIKLSDTTKLLIKTSLRKNENAFISLINSLVLKNIDQVLLNDSIKYNITKLTHRGINIQFGKATKEDILSINMPLDVLLTILSTTRFSKIIADDETMEDDDILIEDIDQEEREYILRKSNTIAKIMETTPLDNETYKKIADLYTKYTESNDEKVYEELKSIIETQDKI